MASLRCALASEAMDGGAGDRAISLPSRETSGFASLPCDRFAFDDVVGAVSTAHNDPLAFSAGALKRQISQQTGALMRPDFRAIGTVCACSYRTVSLAVAVGCDGSGRVARTARPVAITGLRRGPR